MNRTTECMLVAEDEKNLRNEWLEFLRMEGFDVIRAADGSEAFLQPRFIPKNTHYWGLLQI